MLTMARFATCLLLGGMWAGYAQHSLAESVKVISPYQPRLQPDKSFDDLKNDLERLFRQVYIFSQSNDGRSLVMYRNVREFKVTDDGLSVTFENAQILDETIRASDIVFVFRVQYDEFADVLRDGACSNPRSVNPDSPNRYSITLSLPRKINFVNFGNDELFRGACDAMHNMALSYKERQRQEAVRFEDQARRYRALKTKPEMTEAQRRLVVQANALAQERDYSGAIDRYRQLLADDPVSYPAAYYNMALMSAELRLYRSAIRHMNRYLTLVPDANDARAAQDKIYEWEMLAEKK